MASVNIQKGSAISGRFESSPVPLRLEADYTPLEDFANSDSEPRTISLFTERYGPLNIPFRPDAPFRFSMGRWRAAQVKFRRLWDRQMLGNKKAIPLTVGSELKVQPGEFFESDFNNLAYHTLTLNRLLTFELTFQPRERLRRCKRPDCPHPYFLAQRLQQMYCSEPCAQAAQRQEKREWWNKKGTKLRRQARQGRGKRKH